MGVTTAVDGFRLAYDRAGGGPGRMPAVLLHGWPGDRTEYHAVAARLPGVDLVRPDLRGFGGSDRHLGDPTACYGVDAQVRSVVALIEELGLDRPVLGGHDIGSRVAVALARTRPDLVRALVVTPPLPGMGERLLGPRAVPEFWYLTFNQLPVAAELIDGRPDAVRTYLRHFWTHWAGPGFVLPDEHFDRLVATYAEPGAFTASLGWHRASAGALARVLAEHPPAPEDRIRVPATVLWPGSDPLFPPAWADRLDRYFAHLELDTLENVGHFVPLEAPDQFAAAVSRACNRG